MRGRWREGSYAEDFERHATEGDGNGTFIGLHKGNLRHLAREGSANMFIERAPVLDIFFCYVKLKGLCPCVWPQHSREYFCSDSGKLNPEIIRKTYPRPIQAFIRAVERKDRELGGHNGPACERPTFF